MIGIIDYGMGNLQSVVNSCEYVGAEVKLIRTAKELEMVSKVILPGVGAFREGMNQLESLSMVEPLRKAAIEKKVPFLGICLGMQLLATLGTEGGDRPGLDLIKGTVKRFEDSELRVPHVGWNDVKVCRPNSFMTADLSVDYYFVHSYYFKTEEPDDVVATCDYGITFPCVVGRENIFGVQFHPEKSHRFGLDLLRNFFKL